MGKPSGVAHPSPFRREAISHRLSRRLTAAPAAARSNRGDLQSRCPVKILFYGRLAEVIAPELEIDASPGCSVSELRDRLVAEHPAVGAILSGKRVRACVGETLVHDQYVLRHGDRVEFLPPVSGG